MASFDVTLKDRTVERVVNVDGFQQEGTMTTFFRNDEPRQTIDSWSTRVFSVRTSELLMVRRLERGDRAAVFALPA